MGSTWAPYFAEKKILLSPENTSENLSWRKIRDIPVSLPYTIDVRLMFYWKKLPGNSKPFRDILKNASNWQGIIDALSDLVLDENNPSPPMVMPVGLTFNLLHDFVPLVWASGDPFFVETIFGTRTNMGNQASLRVPCLISQHATTIGKNGYLPAQNCDFGLGVLLDMLGGPSCKGAKNAIGLIQTAMKKGREYACTPEWPTRMESIEILEAMQILWRRIGEGNTDRRNSRNLADVYA
jgi:hypothetical protein